MPANAEPPALTEVLSGILSRPIATKDRNRAALHLLDWLGCALAGATTGTGLALTGLFGAHPFVLAGTDSDAAVAGLGGLGSLLEMDDVHRAALLHPGPVIAPVVIGLSGPDPLAALIRGYEAMIRLGANVGRGHYGFFHNTATCGGIGSVVAAGSMFGLNPAQLVSGMGHAMSMAGGLWQCRNEVVATKHLHVAEAARRGVTAARYAQAGLAGPRFILEGPQGFFAAMARDGTPAGIIADMDAPWRLHEVSFKPWPACRHAHPAIDAALILRRQMGGRVPTAIRIETYADALLFCDKPSPRTADEARFSLQHSVAVAFQDGPPLLAAFNPENLANYAALRGKVSVHSGAEFTTSYPRHFGARISAESTEGTFTAVVADAWGDTENPMDMDAIAAKFRRLASFAGVPDQLSRELAAATLALPDGGPITDLHRIMHQISALPTGAIQ